MRCASRINEAGRQGFHKSARRPKELFSMTHPNHPLTSPRGKDRAHQRNKTNRILTHCSECKRETLHDRVHTLEKLGDADDLHLYEFIQCRGGESASMIHRWSHDHGGMWAVE